MLYAMLAADNNGGDDDDAVNQPTLLLPHPHQECRNPNSRLSRVVTVQSMYSSTHTNIRE